jgi:hypothetical protein
MPGKSSLTRRRVSYRLCSMVSTRRGDPRRKRPIGETRELVKSRALKGDPPREIALVLGISTQAVYQHLQALRDAGELPPEKAEAV